MTKTLLYRLFGLGKLPKHLAFQLEGEGMLFLEEGLKGSATYRNFRAPGRYANWKRQGFTACLALTQMRLLGLRFSQPIINVPLADERLRRMRFSLEQNGTLLVAFEAGLFQPNWSGTIEYRFGVTQGQTLLDKLRERTG